MSFRVTPLSDALAAQVTGLDLSEGLAAEDAARLSQALLDHVVLVVRAQALTPDQYVAAMASLGRPARQNHAKQLLSGHPEIWVIDSREAEVAEDGRRLLFGANCWHTDHTNLPLPPKITALYSVRLPPSGGDTSFINACSAYEALAPAIRSRIDGLQTVYGADRHLKHREEDRDAFAQPVSHPLVRTHPETKRKALYCHPLKAQYIEGMQPSESFELIDRVMDDAVRGTPIYRHAWQPGDLVLIDNRACLHRAERDYDPDFGRVMHRMIIEGDRPV